MRRPSEAYAFAVAHNSRTRTTQSLQTGAFPGVFTPISQDGLPSYEKMLPELLQEVGYGTYMVGK